MSLPGYVYAIWSQEGGTKDTWPGDDDSNDCDGQLGDLDWFPGLKRWDTLFMDGLSGKVTTEREKTTASSDSESEVIETEDEEEEDPELMAILDGIDDTYELSGQDRSNVTTRTEMGSEGSEGLVPIDMNLKWDYIPETPTEMIGMNNSE